MDLIGEYEKHLRGLRRSGSTIETYMGVLRRMDAELASGLVAAYQEELHAWIFQPGRANATYDLYVLIVQGFTRWATSPKREYRLDHDEAADLPRVGRAAARPKPVPPAVLTRILAEARPPWRIIFKLGSLGGLRCIEIERLHREHVDPAEMTLHGKGGKFRTVPVHPAIWDEVAAMPRGPLAVDGGVPLDRRQISHRGRDRLHAMGFPYSMHQLRHAFATQVHAASGYDLALVQDLLGHADVSTTRRYVEVSPARKVAAVLGLGTA